MDPNGSSTSAPITIDEYYSIRIGSAAYNSSTASTYAPSFVSELSPSLPPNDGNDNNKENSRHKNKWAVEPDVNLLRPGIEEWCIDTGYHTSTASSVSEFVLSPPPQGVMRYKYKYGCAFGRNNISLASIIPVDGFGEDAKIYSPNELLAVNRDIRITYLLAHAFCNEPSQKIDSIFGTNPMQKSPMSSRASNESAESLRLG